MKKSIELKQKIQEMKNKIATLRDEQKLKEAHNLLKDLSILNEELDVALALEAEEEQNFAGEPIQIDQKNISPLAVFNKQLTGKPLTAAEKEYLNKAGSPGQVEAVDERGGYLVPAEQQEQIIELRRNQTQLKSYCNVFPVTRKSGSAPLGVEDNTYLTDFEELNEMNQAEVTFGQVKWTVKDKGDIIPVSNSLLEDTAVNLVDYIGRRFTEKATRTENRDIIALMNTATSVEGADHTLIATALNTKLDPAIADTAVIFTNQTSFDWLDKLTDKNGQALLTPDLADAGKKLYKGKPIVILSDTLMAPGATKDFFVGDLSAFVTFFDRKGVEMAVSAEAGFTKNATYIRVIERYDVQKVDAKAMVKVAITATA